MADGKVLVAGGDSSDGVVNKVEIYGANGAFAAAAPMAQARSGAACATMADGRVFVSGGTAAGSALASAEIFDPASGEWSSAGSMAAARSGHTATVTPWGAVLLAGGDADGTVELYRPSINQFLSIGTLSAPRKDYAMAVVPGSRLVVIAGGSAGGRTLGTVDIYDGNRDRLIAGGAMAAARRNFVAAPLADGTVLLAGGYADDGTVLASTEIYDPATGKSAAGPDMAEARAEHKGYTLPSNGSVILLAGTNGRDLLTSSEVYTPWTGKWASTGTLHTARTAASAALLRKGGLIVAGGKSGNKYLTGGELYSFATVDTDKLDYFPGDIATITGAGWKAGEEVQIQVTSFPIDQHKVEFTAAAVADATGRIKAAGFNIDKSHLGARFLLHATGSKSQAEALFTDAGPTSISVNPPTPASPSAFPTGVQYTGNVVDNANTVAAGSLTVTVDNVFVSNATVIAGTGDFDTNTPGPGITNLAPGTHLIGFAYPATGASGASSTSKLFQVNSVTTTTAISSAPAVLTYGQTTIITGSVVSNGGYNVSPTGTVVCTDGVNPVLATLIPVIATPGTSNFSCTTPATLTVSGSPHSYHASYAGFTPVPTAGIPNPTQIWQGSQSGSVNIAVNPATVTVAETTSVLSPVTFGTPVTLTTTVSVNAPGIGPPVGQVTFLNNGVAIAGCGPQDLVAVLQQGTSSCGPITLPGGLNNLTVHYSPGSSNFGPAGGTDSGTTAFQVNSAATTTAITGSSASQNFGLNETFTATVSSACGALCGPPAGSVLFYDVTAGPPFAVLNNGVPITLTPSGLNGVASIIVNNIAPGARSIRAFYTHTGTNFTDSNSAGLDFAYTVNKIAPIITIQLSPNNPAVGQTVTVTASAAQVVGQVPTGQAFMLVNATSQGINKSPVSGIWTFTFVADRTNPNPQNVRITTDGSTDTYFLGQIGSAANQVTFTVNLAPTTTTVTSVPLTPVAYGASIALSSATSSSAQGSAIGGTVDYFEGSVGGNLLNPVPVTVTNGAANFAVPQATINTILTAGTHSIFARYNGDTNYGGANSPAYTLIISPDVTTTTVNTLPASTTTANIGGTVTYVATVTDTSTTNITPTGSITFFDNGNNVNASCAAAPSLAWVSGVGTATCALIYNGTAPLTAGSHAVTAVYQGTPAAPINVLGSSNNSNPYNITVTSPTMTLGTPTTNPAATSLAGAAIYNNGGVVPTLSIPVTLNGAVTPAPTKQLQLFDGGVAVGSPVPVVNGTTVFNLPASVYQGVSSSPHILTVSYPTGDPNYASVTSPSVAYFVIKFTPSVSGTGFSVNPPFGTSITLGGTVNSALVGGGAAALTGSLTFSFGATTLGSCTIAGGSCTITGQYPVLVVGADAINIAYVGDANYAAVSNNASSVNVVPNSVTTTVTTSPTPSANVNTNVVITATVAPAASGAGIPTGSVTFFDAFNGAAATSIGTSTLNASGKAFFSTASLQSGPHVLTAAYAGDTNFTALGAPSSVAANLNITTGGTSVNLTPSATSIGLGAASSVTYSVTVTAGNTPPQGSVTLTDTIPGGPAITNLVNGSCANPISLTAGSGNTSSGSCNVIYNGADAVHGVGTHGMVGTYASTNTALWANGTSATQAVTVTGNTPTINTPQSSVASPVYNQQTALSVQVNGLNGGPAISGSVNFFDLGTLIGSAALGGPNGSNQATATLALAAYSVGTHTITATYTGNTSYGSATSGPLSLVVAKNTTSTTLTQVSTTQTYGIGDLLTATVTPTPIPGGGATGTPTGTVTFAAGGTVIGTSNVTGAGPFTASVNLINQLTPSITAYNVTATYNADTNFSGSVSAASSIAVQTNSVTTVVTTSPAGTAALNTAVVIRATLTPAAGGSGTPTGTVTFFDAFNGGAATSIGTSSLNAGVAILSTSNLLAGPHVLTATYTGDANFGSQNSSTSASLTVTTGNTNVTLTPSATSITLGSGSSITYTIGVTGGNTPPQGTVNVVDSLGVIGNVAGGGTCFAAVTLVAGSGNNSSGSCNVVYNGLDAAHGVGTHNMQAQYLSTNTNNWASGNSALQTVTVTGVTATINTPSDDVANPLVWNQPSTISVTVSGLSANGSPAISGSVNFFDGATLLGSANLGVPNGSNQAIATLASRIFSVGGSPHTITATYTGNANYSSVTSAPLSLVVNKALTNTALSPASTNNNFGVSDVLTATVTVIAPAPVSSIPTGIVSFRNGGVEFGQGTLNGSGVATFNLTTQLTPGANYSVSAFYLGDATDFASSQAGSTFGPNNPSLITINKNTVTGTLTATPPTAAPQGTAVTFTATFTPASSGAGTPTGTVTFTDSFNNVTLGSGTLNASGVATLTTSAIVPNSNPRTITATFTGPDNNFTTGATAVLSYSVNQGTTTVILNPSPNSVPVGVGANSTITYNYSVTGGPANTVPQGTVTILNNNANIQATNTGTCSSVSNGFSGGSGNTATGSCTIVYDGAGDRASGSHSMTASYTPTLGSLNVLAPAVSAAQVVTIGGPSTTTTLQSSLNPAVVTNQVTYTFTVTGPSGTTLPAGSSVTLTDAITGGPGTAIICDSSTPLSGAANIVTGTCTITYSGGGVRGVGTHPISATFNSGNAALWAGSTSAVTVELVNKLQPTPQQTVSTSLNPANANTCGPVNICYPYGTTVNLSITMNPANPTPPYCQEVAGCGVIFTDTLNGVTTTLGTATITVPSGVATLSNVLLKGGSHNIIANFPGDNNYLPDPSSVQILVNPATLVPGGSISVAPGNVPGIITTYGGVIPQAGQPTPTVSFTAACGLCVLPTGTFTLSVGGTPIAPAFTITGATTNVVINPLPATLLAGVPAGTGQVLTVTYSGDAQYTLPAAPALTTTIFVAKANPGTFTLNSSPNPSAVAQPVTFVANVTNPVGQPSGNVAITDLFNGSTSTLTPNALLVSGVATYVTSALTAGSHAITGTYNGDNNFNTAVVQLTAPATPGSQIVSANAVTVTVTPSTNNTALNTTVTFTVLVQDPVGTGQPAPIGSILLFDNITGTAQGLPATACANNGILTVVNPPINPPASSVICTITYDNTTAPVSVHGPGTHTITAQYTPAAGPGGVPPATTWSAASSAVATVSVGIANTNISQPVVTVPAAPPYTYGTNITFTTTVSPHPASPAYTGNVNFFDNGVPIPGPGCTPAPPNSTSGLYTCTTTTPLTAGNHTITAQFAGDTNYSQSPVSALLVISVGKFAPTVGTPSPAPTYTTTYAGNLPTLTGTVSNAVAPPALVPSGTVTLASGTVIIATANVDGGGVFTFPTPTLPASIPVGAGQPISITYSGDSNYSAGTAFSNSSGLTVTKSPVTTTVTSINVPPATAGNPVFGQTVSFTATFTNVAGNAVAGFAAFSVDSAALGACGNVAVTNVNGVNSATCIVALTAANGMGVGTHTVSVIAITDANHTLGTTNPLVFTVNQAGTTTGSSISSTTIVGNPNPMPSAGQPVTFTATINLVAPGSAPLNGQVTFSYLGTTLPCNGVAGPVALNGTTSGSTATCNVAASTAPFNATGSYIITASYHDSTPNSPTADSAGNVTEVVARPAPTVSITSNSTPVPGLVRTFQSNYGDSVTFTATLTVSAGAPPLTGTVQFFDGANALGGNQAVTGSGTTFTSTLTIPSAGVATQCSGQPSTVLCGGNHTITASYVPGSDLNYAPATSPALTQIVNKQNTTTTLSAPVFVPGPNPVFGQEVKVTVTVAPSPASALGNAPTGQVILLDGGGTQIGPVQTIVPTSITPCAAGGVNVSCYTFDLIGPLALSVGPHALTAQYVGDTNYIASSSPALNPPLNVLPAPTKTVVNTATFPNPANFGSQITLTATVCALQPGSNTTCSALSYPTGMVGSITFYDGATKLGVSPAVIGSPAGATGSITVTMETPPFVTVGNNSPVGAHNITAVFNDPTSFQQSAQDFNFASSTSVVVVLTISKGITNVSVTTLVTSSSNPSVYGQPVTLTAIVTAPSSFATAPTGTVTFFDGGTQIGIASVALVSAGGTSSTASLTVPSGAIPTFSVGQHIISVTYNGDANYLTSSSPLSGPNALVQVVKQDPTTTLLSSSTNGSNVGQTITLYAQVSANAPGSGVPTGTVNFLNLAAPIQPAFLQCAVGGTAGPAVLVASGNAPNLAIATCTTNNLPQGSLQVSAVYTGDTNFLTSTSNLLTQAVSKTPTNIILTSSLTPSIYGQAVSFSITVTPIIPQLTSATACPGAGCPTGQVQVFDGTSQLATLTLSGGGTQYTTSQLTVGLHAISVVYVGDVNFQPFTTPSIAQLVNKIPTSLALVSNAFTAVASQVLTFTATLSPSPVAGVPFASGQVGFYDGTNLMGVANLQSNVATLNVANLPVGLHQISAIYTGDGNWTGATSGFYAETISTASTTAQIVSSANPSVYGQVVTFTINVTVPFPGTVPATGQVQLYDNHNALGDPINASNGQFTFTVQNFTPGTHNIIATFINNGSFSTSSSAVLPQVVNKAPTLTTLAVVPNGSTSNQQVSMTAVVSVPTPGAGVPSGAVQFVDSTFSQVLGTAPLQVIGGVYMATLTTNALNQSGSPQILVATYSGDNNFATSTSNPQGQSVFGTQLAVVNAAGYSSSNLAADEIATAFGQNLASTALSATTTPLPTSMAGTSVQVTDSNGTQRLAPLFFVSPNQINFLIPSNTAFGLATVSITNPQGATASTVILVTRTAPGVFSANASGQGVAAALIQRVHADGTQGPLEQVAVFDTTQKLMVPVPITIGTDTLYLQGYGTGIRYAPGIKSVTCTINGVNAPVLYAGAAPGFVGLDQFNVQIPAGMAGAGTVNVTLVVDGEAANTVTLTFK